jgi:DNA-binding MarR family transcriptional regulator/GNAT superfamily N-acetyltransferase
MTTADLAQRIAAVRAFNRFYTLRMGWLRRGLLKSPFSLTQARVLYELAHRERPNATDLTRVLDLDAGYLSRILRRFVQDGLLKRTPSRSDGRQRHLALTQTGRRAFAALDRASRAEAEDLLGALDPDGQSRLTAAMGTIQRLLAADQAGPDSFLLRPHRVGDMGWIVHRQALLYAREYGWTEQFEGLVAGIAGRFIENFDPARECCWIAEREGEIVGSVFVVRHSKTEARLRMLYVEPAARGLGVGRRLTEEAIRFARDRGYRTLKLWTNDILVSARRIYESAGFRLIGEERHHSFGHDLVGQTWVLKL